MPKQNDPHALESRREFLRTLTVGAGIATVAIATNSTAATRVEDTTPVSDSSDAKKGYHVTPHIVDYYKSAAF